MRLHTRVMGSGPRVVFVHGSLTTSEQSWGKQEVLAERWTLVIPDRRGYAPNPIADRSDFEDDAADIAPLLDGSAHLVGHSYGATVALCIAGLEPDAVRSLTLIETPPTSLVRGDPPIEQLIAAFEDRRTSISDPYQFMRAHLETLGAPLDRLPNPLPEAIDCQVRLLMNERPPWELHPSSALTASPFPKLVISGDHSPAFERLCDVIADSIGGERAHLAGRGHTIPTTGEPYNALIQEFMLRAEAR